MMKKIALLFVLQFAFVFSHAQEDTVKVASVKEHLVIKNDGTRFQGVILSQDEREILIETRNLGKVYIPKHEIREIKELSPKDYKYGSPLGGDNFSTRYFLTTNGLPVEKGDYYVQWNLFGPDFQFGISDNFGLGIMTTWVGMPLIGTAKYTVHISDNVNVAIGALLGTGSWAAPDYAIALPYAALTFGDRSRNINLSAGYGALWTSGDGEGRFLASAAGLISIGDKISLVFDSFIVPPGGYRNVVEYYYDPNTQTTQARNVLKRNPGLAVLVPGVRLHTDYNKAFQFGFAGIIRDNDLFPLPIPMVQWYRKL